MIKKQQHQHKFQAASGISNSNSSKPDYHWEGRKSQQTIPLKNKQPTPKWRWMIKRQQLLQHQHHAVYRNSSNLNHHCPWWESLQTTPLTNKRWTRRLWHSDSCCNSVSKDILLCWMRWLTRNSIETIAFHQLNCNSLTDTAIYCLTSILLWNYKGKQRKSNTSMLHI